MANMPENLKRWKTAGGKKMEKQRRQFEKRTMITLLSTILILCCATTIISFGADQKQKGEEKKTSDYSSYSTVKAEEDSNLDTEVDSSSLATESRLQKTESTTKDCLTEISSSETSSSETDSSSQEFEIESKEELSENEEESSCANEEYTCINQNNWQGEILTPDKGCVEGPSGEEVYYNLYMGTCVEELKSLGIDGDWWVRSDGVQMFGNYVMVAANLDYRPKGTIIETTLGTAIVADGCEAAYWGNPYLLDISVTW